MDVPDRVVERVLTKVTLDHSTGCILSTYSTNASGYAQVGWEGRGERGVAYAHRVAWFAAHGPIPDGLTVDHMCKAKVCVNVEHLRLLSRFENTRRGYGREWPLGECRNGHSNEWLFSTPSRPKRCYLCYQETEKKRLRECIDCGGPCDHRAARCRPCHDESMRG